MESLIVQERFRFIFTGKNGSQKMANSGANYNNATVQIV